jgi:hypothetical protein
MKTKRSSKAKPDDVNEKLDELLEHIKRKKSTLKKWTQMIPHKGKKQGQE